MFKKILFLIGFSLFTAKITLAAGKSNIEQMIESAEIWKSDTSKFKTSFPDLSWEKGDAEGEYVNSEKGMKIWGDPVLQMNLTERDGKISSLKLTLLDQGSAMIMNQSMFNSNISRWNRLISEKLKSKGKIMPEISFGKVNHARIGWNTKAAVVVLSANQGIRPDRIELVFYEHETGIAQLRLKGQQNAEAKTEEKEKIAKKDNEDEGEDEAVEDEYVPSEVKKEIATVIKEINARPAPSGVSKEVQDAVNLLNIYRYLSKVPYEVEADRTMNTAANDAAKICNVKGDLSHDFGHSTDKCNLAMNSGGMTMAVSVKQYMEDSGANNRERRGHRRWCLNHTMKKTGFGLDGGYSAMYSMDQSGRGTRKNYSYPGHGFYPLDYLHGNGWSYHLAEGSAPADTEVKIWKMKKFNDKAPKWSDEPDGRELKVGFKFIYSDTIVFEPDSDPITRKGSYLIRLKGGGLKEQYVVHLY